MKSIFIQGEGPQSYSSFLPISYTFKAKSSPQTTGEEKPLVKKDREVEKRPMTKKQREEFERQRQSELRKAGKLITADKGVYSKKSIPSKPSSYNQQHKRQDTNKLPNQPAKMTYPSHDTTNGKSRLAPHQSTSNFNKTIYRYVCLIFYM